MRRALLLSALIIATAGIFVGALGPGLLDGDRLWPIAWVLWAPVGYLILIKRPGNGVGTAALLIGLSWGLGFALLTFSVILPVGPAAAWAELADSLLGVLPWLAIVWLLLVYPAGEYPGKAERITGTTLIGFGLIATAAFAVDSTPMEDTGLPSPLAVPALDSVASLITGERGFLAVVALVLAAVVMVVVRMRRSVGVERLQYRWLLMGALIFTFIIAVGNLGIVSEDSSADLLWLLGGAAIPGAIGIAILRYRLYEIDRILSRTVSYTVLVALLAGAFFGAVTLLTSIVESESDLVTAAATLLVASLFNPMRKRVQAWVDRRFNRSRYDAQRVMDHFAESLRDQVDSDEVVTGWVGVVNETMQPAAVGVWIRSGART